MTQPINGNTNGRSLQIISQIDETTKVFNIIKIYSIEIEQVLAVITKHDSQNDSYVSTFQTTPNAIDDYQMQLSHDCYMANLDFLVTVNFNLERCWSELNKTFNNKTNTKILSTEEEISKLKDLGLLWENMKNAVSSYMKTFFDVTSKYLDATNTENTSWEQKQKTELLLKINGDLTNHQNIINDSFAKTCEIANTCLSMISTYPNSNSK